MTTATFELSTGFAPTGDQPQAIAEITAGIERAERFQTLLGVTGSGKTFTMANVIAQTGRPALVIAHNKTLAAQLCNEFREFLPGAAVDAGLDVHADTLTDARSALAISSLPASTGRVIGGREYRRLRPLAPLAGRGGSAARPRGR